MYLLYIRNYGPDHAVLYKLVCFLKKYKIIRSKCIFCVHFKSLNTNHKQNSSVCKHYNFQVCPQHLPTSKLLHSRSLNTQNYYTMYITPNAAYVQFSVHTYISSSTGARGSLLNIISPQKIYYANQILSHYIIS